mmetsp:Transcript_34266/g.70702  ORF Transcript_34266/g.70702 Transcript_34266/m.70702 type:complete len:142 (-) Transcript_34266:24-449(-)
MAAPRKVPEMTRAHEPITLGQARAYQAPRASKNITGCYKIVRPRNAGCCPGKCIGCGFPCECCGCVWTPQCYCFLDCLVGLFFCNCRDSNDAFRCDDLKGNTFIIEDVSGDSGRRLAVFSGNKVTASVPEDEWPVQCYCEK